MALSEPDRVGSATRDIAIERGNMTFYFPLMTCLLLSLLISLVSLGCGLFVVDSQIPLDVFGRVMEANEVVFFLRGRPVLAPYIALVEYKSSVVDGMLVRSPVKRRGHGYSPLRVVTHPILGLSPVSAFPGCRDGSPLKDKARRMTP